MLLLIVICDEDDRRKTEVVEIHATKPKLHLLFVPGNPGNNVIHHIKWFYFHYYTEHRIIDKRIDAIISGMIMLASYQFCILKMG